MGRALVSLTKNQKNMDTPLFKQNGKLFFVISTLIMVALWFLIWVLEIDLVPSLDAADFTREDLSALTVPLVRAPKDKPYFTIEPLS
jgi:hypothetical protein